MKTINSFRSKLLALTLALMASVSSFAHDFSVDGIYYNIIDEKNVEVTYKGSSAYEDEYKNEVVIPDSVTYNGVSYIVTSIGKNAFAYSALLKTITIGNNVKSVGDNAFSNCNLLASVTMGTAVQNVGKYAFYNCSYLSVIDSVPNSLTTVEESAFRACSQLTAINLPDSVTTIGDYAFYECYRLASVTLGNGLTSIGDQAFMYCSALKSIVIPNSVTNIGASAFNCCSSLDSVAIGNGLRKISDCTFYKCSALVYFTMPDSIESIGKHAFFTCKSLKNINVPRTVTTIGDYAFSGCSELESIHIPEGVLEIRERTFENCSSLKSILLPQSITSIGNNAFAGCAKLPAIDIPEGVKSIEGSTFKNCTSLAAITIPNTVMTIKLGAFSNTAYYNDAMNWEEGVLYISNCLIEAKTSIAGDYSIKPGTRLIADYALFGCSNLTSVTFAQSVKSIGDASFYECKNMKVVNMSDSLQNIGDCAFAYCELLNPVTIPVGVKTFGTEVFMGCKSLVSIIWNAKECQDFPDFYEAPFYRISSKITSITFGDEVEYIPAGMCYGLSAVPSVTIPVNVKRIGKDAFESCTSMTSITWNAKHYCDTLDYPPFEGLEYIVKSFTFGEGIETIPPYICKEMREVSEIIIPKGVKSIGRHAFNYCLSIPSIIIPEGVTTIGGAAFFHTQIRSVIVPEGVTEIGGWAFSECYGLNKIELPSTLNSIGNSAFKETYHIDTLICRAVLPPTMGELPVFEGVKTANISLFVPKESIELYKKADQWKDFGQILPIEPTTDYKSQWCDTWNVMWFDGMRFDETASTSKYRLGKDTIIGDYTYSKFTSRTSVRFTSDRKVYVYYEGFDDNDPYTPDLPTGEYLAYDFSAQVGDTLEVFSGGHSYSKYKCLVREVQTDPETNLRTIKLYPIYAFDENERVIEDEITWIEGLGSSDGFLIGWHMGRTGGGTFALLCAYKDDELQYTGGMYDEYGCEYNAGVVSDDLFPTLSGLQRTICSEYCEQADNKTRIEQFTNLTTRTETGGPYIYCSPFLLREKDNKILIYSRSLDKDLVLYDFNLQVGDSLPMLYIDFFAKDDWIADRDMELWCVVDYHKDLEGNILPADTLIVTDVSAITLLDGKEYKQWTFNNGMEYVEGIGSFGNDQWSGDFFQLIANKGVPTSLLGEHLVCVSKNNKLLYQMDDAEMERLGTECLCDYNSGPKKDHAKDGQIGGRPTPTQWNQLEVVLRQMDNNHTILQAETFSYTLEDISQQVNNKTYFQLVRQSTKDTATTKSVVGALHFGKDEDNRVYFLRDGVEYVLYDFTAEPGDTVEIFAGINNYPQETTYTHVVVDKDTTEDGACRMLLEVVFPDETTAENAEKVWLAGLGSVDGIVHNAAKRTSNAHAAPSRSASSSETESSVMLCAWRDDSCLYTTDHPDYDTFGCVYNQEPTSVKDIHSSQSSYQKLLRDGQLFIIHNGKTYNVLGVKVN